MKRGLCLVLILGPQKVHDSGHTAGIPLPGKAGAARCRDGDVARRLVLRGPSRWAGEKHR